MAYIQTERAGLWLKNKGTLIQNKEVLKEDQRENRNKGTMMRLGIDKEQACLDIHNE